LEFIDAAEKVIVALDCPERQALETARFLKQHARWFKVGMTLYYKSGPAVVAKLRDFGFNVFVDLKLHDIPHQVRGAARSVVESGANMLTVHAAGGAQMLQAAVEGVEDALNAPKAKGTLLERYKSDPRPLVLAVTMLTSMDQDDLVTQGIGRPMTQQVQALAQLARDCGLDGVICSPHEVAALRRQWPEAVLVTPGVRPAGSSADDQSRVATPQQACQAGASYLVVGRPIMAAADPYTAFTSICEELL